MESWIFKFPPLKKDPPNLNRFKPDTTDYPYKLLFWEKELKLSGVREWYDEHRFTSAELYAYDRIITFYGLSLLNEEVRAYAALKKTSNDEYLAIVDQEYVTLETTLNNLFKVFPENLYYINAIERRNIFLRVQSTRTNIFLVDVELYQIKKFDIIPQFTGDFVDEKNVEFQVASMVFWQNIRQLNNIDPYGNLYLTRSLDLTALQALLNKYPKYSEYFKQRLLLKEALAELVNLFNVMTYTVQTLKILVDERQLFSKAMKPDQLVLQNKTLTSNKVAQVFTRLNTKIYKLNTIFVTFNASYVLSVNKKVVDLKQLTDNFFYSDYLSARDSVHSGLQHKLEEIVQQIST